MDLRALEAMLHELEDFHFKSSTGQEVDTVALKTLLVKIVPSFTSLQKKEEELVQILSVRLFFMQKS